MARGGASWTPCGSDRERAAASASGGRESAVPVCLRRESSLLLRPAVQCHGALRPSPARAWQIDAVAHMLSQKTMPLRPQRQFHDKLFSSFRRFFGTVSLFFFDFTSFRAVNLRRSGISGRSFMLVLLSNACGGLTQISKKA